MGVKDDVTTRTIEKKKAFNKLSEITTGKGENRSKTNGKRKREKNDLQMNVSYADQLEETVLSEEKR